MKKSDIFGDVSPKAEDEKSKEVEVNKEGAFIAEQPLIGAALQAQVVAKEKEQEISEIAIDYNVLRVLVHELTVTNQNLVDKYIGMSKNFEEVQGSKENLERKYEELSEKVKRLEEVKSKTTLHQLK